LTCHSFFYSSSSYLCIPCRPIAVCLSVFPCSDSILLCHGWCSIVSCNSICVFLLVFLNKQCSFFSILLSLSHTHTRARARTHAHTQCMYVCIFYLFFNVNHSELFTHIYKLHCISRTKQTLLLEFFVSCFLCFM
jgi:hypothetical protein